MRVLDGCLTLAGALLMALPAHAQDSLNFRDEFTGSTLAPEFRVVNPDPNRMALVEGEYLMLLTHADTKNIIIYTGRLPEDFTATIHHASVPEYDRQGGCVRKVVEILGRRSPSAVISA